MRLHVTDRGFAMLREGEAIFDELRDQWQQRIGPAKLAELESLLTELIGTEPIRLDTPGWLSRDLGESI
jgi:hypothetical protein